MTSYWCELRLARRADARSRACCWRRRGRRDRGGRRPARPARRRRAAPRRAHPPRPRERPLARLPARAARPHPARQRLVLDLARADVRAGRRGSTRTSYLALARATYAEMALAGITRGRRVPLPPPRPDGVPYDDPNAMGGALIAAAAEAGIRITLLDACYLHGGIGKPPDGAQLRFTDGDADAWAERVERAAGRASASDRRGDPQRARRRPRTPRASWPAGRASARRPLHAHVSEQPAENEACLAAYGAHARRQLLAEAGALGAALHRRARHPPRRRRRGAARRRRRALLPCPTTERDLADGIGPARALRDAGASLALGSDSPRGHRPVRGGARGRARRAAGDRRARPPRAAAALLRAATADGHAGLGWPDAGRIEPGARRRPRHGLASTACASPARGPSDARRGGRVRGGAPPTCGT